jgi:type I restriction-modification system DNA methylase subunit
MTNKQLKNLKDRLWQGADQLRANSGLKSTEYATPILGLIFLRFAQSKYSQHEAEIKAYLFYRDANCKNSQLARLFGRFGEAVERVAAQGWQSKSRLNALDRCIFVYSASLSAIFPKKTLAIPPRAVYTL